jgi:hypothetical protein
VWKGKSEMRVAGNNQHITEREEMKKREKGQVEAGERSPLPQHGCIMIMIYEGRASPA